MIQNRFNKAYSNVVWLEQLLLPTSSTPIQ